MVLQFLFMISSVLEFQLILRLHLHQWLLLASHKASSALHSLFNPAAFMTPKPVSQTHYQARMAGWEASLALSGPQLLCADSEETPSRRLRLQWWRSLVNHTWLWSTRNYRFSIQRISVMIFASLWNITSQPSTLCIQLPRFHSISLSSEDSTSFPNTMQNPPQNSMVTSDIIITHKPVTNFCNC